MGKNNLFDSEHEEPRVSYSNTGDPHCTAERKVQTQRRGDCRGHRTQSKEVLLGLRAGKVVVLDGEASLAWASGAGDALTPGDRY